MGAELGATSSIFPSDEMTRRYMKSQGREHDWQPLEADDGALYDDEITIDLAELTPMVALPHSPDNVKAVCELEKTKVDQVAVGSCTNSSYHDLYLFAKLLKGKVVHPQVSLVVAPGSRQVYMSLARDGVIESLISSGARILETACGPCIGMGQAPPSGAVSVRTFNRNFTGRSGTADARVYLAGPAVAAAAALYGYLIDPREMGEYPLIPEMPGPEIDDRMIISPPADGSDVEIIRGPNIKPIPVNQPLPEKLTLKVLLHVDDNITTDHILPGGSKVLPLRSNIEALSEYTFSALDDSFAERAKKSGGGIVVAGENYGQGSSREHAALAPMHLGLKAVLAKSFARIHRANLINFGILPLIFFSDDDYNSLSAGDELVIEEPGEQLKNEVVIIKNISKNKEIKARHGFSPRQLDLIRAGGLLNYTSQK
jgi:aconitate hydratase